MLLKQKMLIQTKLLDMKPGASEESDSDQSDDLMDPDELARKMAEYQSRRDHLLEIKSTVERSLRDGRGTGTSSD